MKNENIQNSVSKWRQKNASKKFREVLEKEEKSWNVENLKVLLNLNDWLPTNVSFYSHQTLTLSGGFIFN